jgi:hypothetical protein
LCSPLAATLKTPTHPVHTSGVKITATDASFAWKDQTTETVKKKQRKGQRLQDSTMQRSGAEHLSESTN